jgi:hypothetical protein
MDNVKFKIHGKNRLVTYAELLKIAKKDHVGMVRVVDLKSQRNYLATIAIIKEKFQ